VSGVAYLCALVLAGVVGVAGAAKLRRPRRTAASFAALGLPRPRAMARAVPVAELALSATLVAMPAVGAAGALAALAAFTVVIGRSLRSGAAVSCGCFGSAGDDPVSGVELVRNGLLAVLAVTALAAAEPAAPELAEVVLVSTAVVTAVVGLALARLRRDVGAVWDNTLAGEASP
jgi:hypothetical protein